MSGLPPTYGVPFPTTGGGAGNPYPPSASSYAAVSPPPQQQQVQIQPGSITYTTTTLQDGRIQYNQFRSASDELKPVGNYQTPQGPVHGIQWIPVNVSYEIPSNAHPAGPDFHSSWSRTSNDRDSQRTLKEWQRDQEKRAKKEEKESAKRMKEWEKERREREKAEEKELRRAQERDLQRGGRQRRLSDVGYGAEYPTYSAPAAGHTRARSRSRSRLARDLAGQDGITRAMAEMAMENEWAMSENEIKWERERERRNSNIGRPRRLSVNERPRTLSTSEYDRPRKTSGTPVAGYPTGAYPGHAAPPSPRRATYAGRMSPYMGGGGLPSTGPGGPVYPPGHIYAGKPIPGMQGDSLGNITSSYGPPSPRRSPMQLESPAGFTRPPSLAVPYTYFDPIVILADLNGLFQQLPPMPAVLAPHDVWIEDWIRCLEDIARAWLGKMPMKDRQMNTKKPQNVVAQLIDLWNASFFSLRGVELVLFRGRQRRSGPLAGRYDTRLGLEGSSDDESDTISSVSSDSDTEDRYGFYGGTHTRYGTAGNHWLADSKEARRVRKAEKVLHEKQRRKRREREKERGSGFSLFLTCTNDGPPPRLSHASGYPPVTSGYPG